MREDTIEGPELAGSMETRGAAAVSQLTDTGGLDQGGRRGCEKWHLGWTLEVDPVGFANESDMKGERSSQE